MYTESRLHLYLNRVRPKSINAPSNDKRSVDGDIPLLLYNDLNALALTSRQLKGCAIHPDIILFRECTVGGV
uniref:Uncharacterized protein n=1 Tax=Ditylenchus dipsaci TaxID=166011 RepID=A0A915EKQ5_9BILA